MDSLDTSIVVLGAGVTGLAVARTLAQKYSVIVVEQHIKFGQEISSRNSEVIHSGIYYPLESLKTKLCIRGRELLYEYAKAHGVSFAQCGKLLIATSEKEEEYLEQRLKHIKLLDVPFEFWSRDKIVKEEPLLLGKQALHFSRTGIINSHELMQSLETELIHRGAPIAYQHQITDLTFVNGKWQLEFMTPEGIELFETDFIINCAGLAAADWANRCLETTQYEHRFCRGRYFMLNSHYRGKFQHLIYPIPPKDGLGVHITLDLEGAARLGPDVDWCDGITYKEHEKLYDCDWEKLKPSFVASAQRYCPKIQSDQVEPGLIGIRPKLFVNGNAHSDFKIVVGKNSIHCLGIESPGLTASLAIAEEVTTRL